MLDYLIVIMSYLLGSIPFGLILTKHFGNTDIRKIGSGNIGATNVLRTGSKKLALATLLLDFAKGLVATLIAENFATSEIVIALCALSVVLGHMFPAWISFKGGKGVATSLAVILVLHFPSALFALGTWMMVFAYKRISSLSAICACGAAIFISFLFASFYSYAAIFVISVIVIMRHRENIERLRKGEEKGF